MSIQIISPPQGPTFGQQLNQTINNLGAFFLQSAAMRQQIKDNQQMMALRQQQFGLQKQQFAEAQKWAGPKTLEHAYVRGDITQDELIAGKQKLRAPTDASIKIANIAKIQEEEGLVIGKPVSPKAASKLRAAGVFNETTYTPSGGEPIYGEPPQKPVTPKEPVSTEENPLYVTDPSTNEPVLVPYKRTASSFSNQLVKTKIAAFTLGEPGQEAQRLREKEVAAQLGLAKAIETGDISQLQGMVTGRDKDLRAAEKELIEANGSYKTAQTWFGGNEKMMAVATIERETARNKVISAKRGLAAAKSALSEQQDVSKVAIALAPLKKLNLMSPKGAKTGINIAKKAWNKKTNKNRAAAKAFYDKHIFGKFPEATQNEMIAWLLDNLKAK